MSNFRGLVPGVGTLSAQNMDENTGKGLRVGNNGYIISGYTNELGKYAKNMEEAIKAKNGLFAVQV
jgi:hypothetical protein